MPPRSACGRTEHTPNAPFKHKFSNKIVGAVNYTMRRTTQNDLSSNGPNPVKVKFIK